MITRMMQATRTTRSTHSRSSKQHGSELDKTCNLVAKQSRRHTAIRNIDTCHKSFKAEEWSSFLTQYFPVLLRGPGCLQQNIYEHYMKLVNAIDLAIDYDITFEKSRCYRITPSRIHLYILYYRYQPQ